MAEHSGFQKLVAEAKKHITEISPEDSAAKLNSGDAVVVDVRDKDEWDEGHIPGATHMSRGTLELDIERWRNLDYGTGTAVALVTPRSLESQMGG